jgi:uncharacterized membrane protein
LKDLFRSQTDTAGGGFSSGHRWGILGGHPGNFFYKPFLWVRDDGFRFKNRDYSWHDIKKIIVMPSSPKAKQARGASIYLNDGRRIPLHSRILDKNGQKTKIGFLSFTSDVFEELAELFQQKFLKTLEEKPSLNVLTANQLDKELKKMWCLWWFILLSLAPCAIVCHVLNATWEPLISTSFPSYVLIIILYIVCGLFLILSWYVRNRIMSSKQGANALKNASLTGTNPAINKYVQALIWPLAICANMSFLGLGMFRLTKDWQSLYIVIAIAAVAIIYHRPSRQELEGVVSAMKTNQDFPNHSLENRRA